MEKKLSIIAIPFDGESKLLKVSTNDMSWRDRNKGDLELHDSPWPTNEGFQAHQLLVLSTDRINKGDIFYHEVCGKPFKANDVDIVQFERLHPYVYGHKIIATYPHIKGTLPLSEQTVQEWIGHNQPVDCIMWEEEIRSTDNNTFLQPLVNTEGELTLYFELIDEDELGPVPVDDFDYVPGDFASIETTKTETIRWFDAMPEDHPVSAITIPTQAEIENKARKEVADTEMLEAYPGRLTPKIIADYEYYFETGYLQALKDLGHEKTR
jgi:hypothetical protein